ncbi:MAG: 4-alpha-glucanotransferase, partial [Deltaproteobacteria bacterium]|nr:4-alpha-glucanotransferase [Nannocystaceae bacterium]
MPPLTNPERPPRFRELQRRSSGVLLHPTSLAGPHAIGDFGAGARAFVDFLADAGQRWWQVLPLNPTGVGGSPYSGPSAFAGNPLLIDLVGLAEDGLLTREELPPACARDRVDHELAAHLRDVALRRVVARMANMGARIQEELDAFRRRSRGWLPGYALYTALHRAHGGASWTTWDRQLARDSSAAVHARRELAQDILRVELEQFLFDRQWQALRSYAASRAVGIIGDIPIFVAHDSADVWEHPRLFLLDREGQPTHVSGVPPDYFSATGQRWGTPLYRWSESRRSGHRWWVERFRTALSRADLVRLDHFVGFAHYWAVWASESTAVNGRWAPGPGAELFETVRAQLGWDALPLIAEDLGTVTDEVIALRDRLALPGMRVLQFAFGDDGGGEEFLPHALERHCVLYTGTHDNDTAQGWYDAGGDGHREALREYVGGPQSQRPLEPAHRELVRMAMASVANTTIIPLQDLLGLGSEARMNTPGLADGNWGWRVPAPFP